MIFRRIVLQTLCVALTAVSAWASDAPPSAAPDPGESVAALERDLTSASDELRRLESELAMLEAAPKPVSAASVAADVSATPAHVEFSVAPAQGAEEDLANSLYSLKEYAKAMEVYQAIAAAETQVDRKAWAMLQVGNCYRNLGEHLLARRAYEALMNAVSEHPWALEGGWWCTQINWRLAWDDAVRKMPETPAVTHAKPPAAPGATPADAPANASAAPAATPAASPAPAQ